MLWCFLAFVAVAALATSCGGKVDHDPRGITNVTCWVECVRFYGGSKECVVIDSADDLYDKSFWSKVEAITDGHACPPRPEEHALSGNNL